MSDKSQFYTTSKPQQEMRRFTLPPSLWHPETLQCEAGWMWLSVMSMKLDIWLYVQQIWGVTPLSNNILIYK